MKRLWIEGAGCLALCGLLSWGCGETSEEAEAPGEEMPAPGSEPPPEGDHITAGLTVDGQAGQVRLTLQETLFEPPTRGDNVWTLQVSAMEGGAPLEGCEITFDPRMPAHGNHGTSKVAEVEAMGEGLYKVTQLYLFMRGLWEVHTFVKCGDDVDDSLTFEVWIEG